MDAQHVAIGEVYTVEVSGQDAPVVIDEEHPDGGWVGTNQRTNRQVRIKTVERLGPIWGDEPDTEPEQDDTADEDMAEDVDTEKTMSAVDAAAQVLEETEEPLGTREIYERATEAGYWSSDGQTPWATIYSSIYREIKNDGDEARFVKVERGKFARR